MRHTSTFIGTAAGLLLAAWILGRPAMRTIAADQAGANPPNIVFVLADDLGWADVNCFDPLNRGYYETPHMDRLAAQGMKLTQAYANGANCSPTRAALLSGQYYPHQPIYHSDGISLMPLFHNADASLDRDALYWHFPGYPNAQWRTSPVSLIRSGPWKLMKFYEGNRVELYHLNDDIGEQRDLAEEHPGIRRKLQHKLDQWLEQTDAPMPKPRPEN